MSDYTFAPLKKVAGERGVVDLIVSAGYYQIVSMFMDVDRCRMGRPASRAEIPRPAATLI